MNLLETIKESISNAVKELYGESVSVDKVQINPTPAEFTGDYTVVIFPFVKMAKKAPDVVGAELGSFLVERLDSVSDFNVIKGFLNLEISNKWWHSFLGEVASNPEYGRKPRNNRTVLLEYSSPNTNKPLHLGHVRNCLLGWSCSQILEAVGYDVKKVQIINDRGVAICKSMLAWQKFGAGKTPESEGVKSDHFVGDYYVLFEQKTKEEYELWQTTSEARVLFKEKHKPEQTEKEFFKEYKNHWFNTASALGAEVRAMLLNWESGEEATMALWRQMNNWVYAGFDDTYDRMGVSFDKLYYESDTYLLGKDLVEEGLSKGLFYKKEDGSVWIDLSDAGYDQKVLLRSDGTSVYITQDIGTARKRYQDFGAEKVIYTVADEQNYHFAVLFEVLKRLGEPYANGLFHLSYGLVELPTGRMKTREGTVVDADDLMDEVIRVAREESEKRGELSGMNQEDRETILKRVGLGALKFFMLRVNPRKKMIFNPEESVDLHGQTGPFIQYSYVRTNGLLNRVSSEGIDMDSFSSYLDLQPCEKELLKAINDYPSAVQQAADEYDPSHLANYCYNLAKSYNRFWHEVKILGAETNSARAFRLQISQATGRVLKSGMQLLGIEMPDRM
jgi:arginyl-tRNA synthetase